jgi:hypothetical protein
MAKKVSKKLGRLPSAPRDLARSIPLKSVLKAGYTGVVPDVVAYVPDATNLPMDGNDQLGDCTAAGAAHVETALSQFGQGTPVVPSLDDVIKFYSGSTGYVPGRPNTDQGGDMQTVLKYWNQTGIAGHKIAAYFAVDPKDFDEMRAALYLFGNLYIGFTCTQGFETAFDNGTVFDVVRRDRALGGHCVAIHQITKNGNIKGSTWGGFFEMTPTAWSAWVDEPYAVASQEWVKNNTTPTGLDYNAANAAFQQVAGKPGPFISTGPVTPPPVDPPVDPPVTPPPAGDAVALLTSLGQQISTFLAPTPNIHGR